MDNHFTYSKTPYPKYLLYTSFILGSWLLSCLLHFQIQCSRSSSGVISVPITLGGFLSSPANADDYPAPPPSDKHHHKSCYGRYIYVQDLPARFDILSGCTNTSTSPDGMCVHLSNAGLGPVLASTDDGGVFPSTGWYNTNQYSLEVIFHNRMRQYDCLTADSAMAVAVYVPYYAGLELHRHLYGFNTTVRDAMSADFLQWLSSQPHWAALGGRDHFLVAAKTTWLFRREDGDENACGNNFLTLPESKNMTVLVYESNPWDRKDFAIPYPSYFHPSRASEVVLWQERMCTARRPWLFTFAGARRANGTLAIRDRIIDECATSPHCKLLDCSNDIEGSNNCQSPGKVMALFTSATFCLQPRGDSYMRRSSVDAVFAGCIPVFFHRASSFQQQYLWHLPDGSGDTDTAADRYSVYISRDDVVEGKVKIEEVLKKYKEEEVMAMREQVIKMMPRFLYKDPRVRFEGDVKDAFDVAIGEVMARMRRIRGEKNLEGKYLVAKG